MRGREGLQSSLLLENDFLAAKKGCQDNPFGILTATLGDRVSAHRLDFYTVDFRGGLDGLVFRCVG